MQKWSRDVRRAGVVMLISILQKGTRLHEEQNQFCSFIFKKKTICYLYNTFTQKYFQDKPSQITGLQSNCTHKRMVVLILKGKYGMTSLWLQCLRFKHFFVLKH